MTDHVPIFVDPCRFPAQENVGGDCKIPTLLYYDAKGTVRAAGAEAKDEAIEEMADEEGWIKAEWLVRLWMPVALKMPDQCVI